MAMLPDDLAEPPRDGLRLGEPEHRNGVWAFDLYIAGGIPATMLAFNSEGPAREAHAALRRARNIGRVTDRANVTPAGNPPFASENGAAFSALRQRTYALLEEGQLDSFAGRVIEGFLIALIVANVGAVALETIPSFYAHFMKAFVVFEEFSLAAYAVEYSARVWSSVEDPRVMARGVWRGRLVFALRPLMIVDLVAVAPSLLGLIFGFDLRVLRIFRLFRLLKLARYSQALQSLLAVLAAERSALFASVILLLATVCFFGELMHLAEGGVQPHVLGTMPNGMYWAITTLATVGYGDIVPLTPLGKLIAGATMITGLAIFALPVGIIANGFVTGLSRRRFAITWSMLRRQPLFHGFDVQALNAILEVPTAVIVREHAQIAVAGKDATTFSLVVSGRACVESGDLSSELGAGGIIGEEALDPSGTFVHTVTAETDVKLLVFPGEELRRLCRKYPLLHQRIQFAMARIDPQSPNAEPIGQVGFLVAENRRLRRALSELALEKLAPATSPPG
jgi:voltage-gated potassium channel